MLLPFLNKLSAVLNFFVISNCNFTLLAHSWITTLYFIFLLIVHLIKCPHIEVRHSIAHFSTLETGLSPYLWYLGWRSPKSLELKRLRFSLKGFLRKCCHCSPLSTHWTCYIFCIILRKKRKKKSTFFLFLFHNTGNLTVHWVGGGAEKGRAYF